jgi:hypothetical protein
MVGRDPPPIRGAEEKVSSFLGVEIEAILADAVGTGS